MLGRLAQVIYWAGCGVAFICIAVAVTILVIEGRSNDGPWMAGAVFGSGALSWLMGRAVLYVLAGR